MTVIDQKDVPMEAMKDGRPVYAVEPEYDFKPVVWKDFFTKAKYIPWWIFGIITLAIGIVFTVKKDAIVTGLQPISTKIQQTPGGFVIPVVILFIISFPPLFGHEIIALLCGAVYGLYIGFAIVAAGTFIGEAGTWFAFLRVFRSKAIKLEKTNLNYGALARMTRDGGFWIVFLIRLSAVPSHFSTAVFATCGVNFWYFLLATFLTLPKQITIVYLGALLLETDEQKKDSSINNIIIGISFIITVVAGVYIFRKMSKVKKMLLAEQQTRTLEREEKERVLALESPLVGAGGVPGGGFYEQYDRVDGELKVQGGSSIAMPSPTVLSPTYRQEPYGYTTEYNHTPTKQQEYV